MTIAREIEIILAHGPDLSAAGLDYYQLGLWASGVHHSRVLALNPLLTLAELEDRLQAFLHHGEERPVVLAAVGPARRGRAIKKLLLDNFRINPELIAEVDLQEALDYPDPRASLIKAQNLILMAASQVSRAEPITIRAVPVSTQVLIWGDSFAALRAARDLAGLGYPVLLATPNSSLSPLTPGVPLFLVPEEGLTALIAQVQSHPLIRVALQATVLGFQGSAGDFTVRLRTAPGVLEERVGAVILAPELQVEMVSAPPETAPHPRIISLSKLEEILASPEDADAWLDSAAPQVTVALQVGLSTEGHPLMLRRALAAAARLLARDNCQVRLFVRDAKVAAYSLEADLENALASGLILFKVPQTPALVEDERPCLRFFEPVLHRDLLLSCDLVLREEAYRAAPDNAALVQLLGLIPGPQGFLQPDNVRNLSVTTNRRGIYVTGPGRAVMDLDQAFAQSDAAVTEVQQLLGRGTASALPGRAVVDRGRCVLCLTCHRLCPHGAITWDNRAIIKELACQGCGVCASECPQDAIQIHNLTDDQVVAILDTVDPRLTPRIIAFMCQNSAWEAYHAALQMDGVSLPLGFTPIKMPCTGKIDIDYLLRAFTLGAAGVLVLACHPDNCKSHHGNEYAHWRVERAQALLAEVGVDPHRLLYKSLAANSSQDFLDTVEQLRAQLDRGGI
jgi:coenzyme F420-reducing hydrogenase delta subunit/Pyruvate/2-oxoacid:ferredoxin oxidoreductase delta subunit